MTRPRDVINMILQDLFRKSAAGFGGLLHLGDSRVCDLLAPLRPNFLEEEAGEVTHCNTGIAYKCVMDFYIDWLDEIVADKSYSALGTFGQVAGGLFRQAEAGRRMNLLFTAPRPFPVPEDGV